MKGLKYSALKYYTRLAIAILMVVAGLAVSLPIALWYASAMDTLGGMFSLSSVGTVLMLGGFLGGCGLIAQGVRKLRFAGRFSRIRSYMTNNACETVDVLADRLGADPAELVRDIKVMNSEGMFGNLYLDLQRGMVLLVGPNFVPRQLSIDEEGYLADKEEKRIRSIAPIYGVGVSWFVYAALFPLYSWHHFLLAGLLSGAVFMALRKLAPDRVTYVKKQLPPPPKPQLISTGNTELDQALTSASGAVGEITMLNLRITNHVINERVEEITRLCGQIFTFVQKNPDSLRTVRQTLSYYLPTTIKLLGSYVEFITKPDKSEDIVQSLDKIEDMIQTVVVALKSQLDDLYRDKAVDITIDIEVMEKIMREQGLLGGEIAAEKRDYDFE